MNVIRNGFKPASTVKALLGGLAASGLLALSLNAQAQTCVVTNWDIQTNLTNTDTGTPAAGNRRYGGPCGLRVPVDGTARFLTDESPTAESTYIARFYAFLDSAGADPMIIYAAGDGSTDQIQVWYNFPNAGDLTLRVKDSTAGNNDLTFSSVGTGWHSVEFVWESDASAEVRFAVNDDDPLNDQTMTVDTSGISIAEAFLGNPGGVNTGGTIDFDDFDSRRISRPGRLCRGDTDDNVSISLADLNAVGNEVISGGTVISGGQPDYDENGVVGFSDLNNIFTNHVQIGNSTCVF
ncbi:MAG: hypothetical protein HND55_13145 [Pseudomonadota bacterium]|nr:MAG: hypothetical protein HND55_13145 [Pseudomonadota bacterium]